MRPHECLGLLAVVAVTVLTAAIVVAFPGWQWPLPVALGLMVVLRTAAVRSQGTFWGIAYVSLMFGALHIGWSSALDVVFVTLVGAFFGFVVHRTGSIPGVTLAHGLATIFLFTIPPNLGG